MNETTGAVPADPTDCPACGVRLAGRWCHDCGQDTHQRPRTLRDWASEAFSEANLVDGRTAKTLVALVLRPGALLEAYRDGAGSLYQTPTKLFVVMAALFLLTLKITDVALFQSVARVIDPAQAVVARADPDGVTVHLDNAVQTDEWMQRRIEPNIDPRVTEAITAAAARATTELDRQNLLYENQSNLEQTLLSNRLAAWLPNALWLLMPLYALFLVPFFGRKRMLMEHLTFAMWAHVTGFALLVLLALANTLGAGLPVWSLLVPYLFYFTLAARRYYQIEAGQAAWRGAVHLAMYLLLALTPAAIIVAISVTDFQALMDYMRA